MIKVGGEKLFTFFRRRFVFEYRENKILCLQRIESKVQILLTIKVVNYTFYFTPPLLERGTYLHSITGQI
jgi:hypothetical protein